MILSRMLQQQMSVCECRNQRELLMDLLEDLLQGLQTADMVKGKSRLVDAKVPIIKCNLKFGEHMLHWDYSTYRSPKPCPLQLQIPVTIT